MSNYLGFEPTKEKSFYFVSYNNEDAERITPITRSLSARLPLWYDLGISYGDIWESVISEKIAYSKAILLFFTRGVLDKERSWVAKEFSMAKRVSKRIYVVMLDRIYDHEVPAKKLSFWDDINNLQIITAFDELSAQQIVNDICMMISNTETDNDLAEKTTESPASELPEKKPAAEITEEQLEPDVRIRIVNLEPLTGRRKKAALKAQLQQIRQENKAQLTEVRDRLQETKDHAPADAVQAYQCAREAMVLVAKQLGAYEWEYKLERKIEDFEDAYERNLLEIKQGILSGKRILSERGIILISQVLLGLNDLIEIL